ncbi:MAG: ankyrin repeat domain-containing protein [Saprospiraceae bacterium]|nr:ankyrin repeat domain-containing protein [Saprospiraceae bacterium]
MDLIQKIKVAFETHSPEGIKECLDQGLSPNEIVDGRPLVDELINMYFRSPLFKICMQTLVENGLQFEDKILLAVLTDDAISLEQQLKAKPEAIYNKYTLPCTFTPLIDASLLHLCAEYNHVDSANILLKYGADVNTQAGLDDHGFGGQSPVFHTVNQHNNNSKEMLELLLSHGADLTLTVKGLIWGRGYDWETFIPSVNPISYAMMGLLPQFQRKEAQIYEVVSLLQKVRYGSEYRAGNVPNRYLVI